MIELLCNITLLAMCKNIKSKTEHKYVFLKYILVIYLFIIEETDHPHDENKLVRKVWYMATLQFIFLFKMNLF